MLARMGAGIGGMLGIDRQAFGCGSRRNAAELLSQIGVDAERSGRAGRIGDGRHLDAGRVA
jgi:hypothetical protein